MVDESKLRDLLDGKVSPEEVDDPNLISLIERIYGAEALQAPKVYRPKNLSAGAASILRDIAVSSV